MRIDAATGWSLGLWFVLGVVPTIGESMGWQALANHQGLAAWVQAVGSIGAIVAAFNVANAQNRRAELERWADRAAPVSVLSQIFLSIAMHAEQLLKPLPSEVADALVQKSNHAQAFARLQELGSALHAIPLTEAGSAKVLATLTFAREEIRQLLDAAKRMDDEPACRVRVTLTSTWFLRHCNELSRSAARIRKTGEDL